MKHFAFVLLFSIVCCIQYKEPDQELLLKLVRGSWIVSEYKINVLDGEEVGKPVYHQINVTKSENAPSASFSEVDVRTGELVKHYFDINVVGASVLSTKAEIVFPGESSRVPFRVSFPNEQTITAVFSFDDYHVDLTVAEGKHIVLSVDKDNSPIKRVYSGKMIEERKQRTFFERFGGIFILILAMLIIVVHGVLTSKRKAD